MTGKMCFVFHPQPSAPQPESKDIFLFFNKYYGILARSRAQDGKITLDVGWREGRGQEILSQKCWNYDRGDTRAQSRYWLREGRARLAGNLGDGDFGQHGEGRAGIVTTVFLVVGWMF